MKQLIVLVASVLLGIALFGMIAGPDDSVYSAVGGLWDKEVTLRTVTAEPAKRP